MTVVALLASMADVQDLHFDQTVIWAATSGGVEVFDTTGTSLATLNDLPNRQTTAVGFVDDTLTVGTAQGAFQWVNDGWLEVGNNTPVVAVTVDYIVYRDGTTWPESVQTERIVDAVSWRGESYGLTADGRLIAGDEEWLLPGPPADVEVVDDTLKIACHIGAAIFDGVELRTLPIPATAAGAVWGTSEGAIVDDFGVRVGAIPGSIREIREVMGQYIVAGDRGVWAVGATTEQWTQPGPCGNFVTGITNHKGEIVIGTFNDGACRYDGENWTTIETPSTMVNDVTSTGEDLWIATAEGLVQEGQTIHVEVVDNAPRGTPGTNHKGINAVSSGPSGLWAADVLGPVNIDDWRRYRWHVEGHSYQTIASCPDGEVWAGSEDDGLAIFGANIGTRRGRSRWRQFNRLDGLPEDWIMAVACAGPGAAWVGTYRNGVGRVDSTGWNPLIEGLWVQALLPDGDRLWIGAADGLYLAEGEHIERVRGDDVHTLYKDGETIWVGTRSGLLALQ
jgi:ligand-binding sensor domain-containing protein